MVEFDTAGGKLAVDDPTVDLKPVRVLTSGSFSATSLAQLQHQPYLDYSFAKHPCQGAYLLGLF